FDTPSTYRPVHSVSFIVNPPPSTAIYTLSLHDALPIFDSQQIGAEQGNSHGLGGNACPAQRGPGGLGEQTPHQLDEQHRGQHAGDRKSTRLNSSHVKISYAVFCLKKKRVKEEINDMDHS